MPQRGRCLEVPQACQATRGGPQLALIWRRLREDRTHAWDDDCGRPRDVRTRPADLAAWADAAQGAACLQDLRYACPRQVERHCLSDLLRRTSHRYRMADWAATRARSRALLHCDPESVRQWALDLAEQSCRAFWARPHPSHHALGQCPCPGAPAAREIRRHTTGPRLWLVHGGPAGAALGGPIPRPCRPHLRGMYVGAHEP